MKYFKQIEVAEFQLESGSLKTGDKILVSGPTTGALYAMVDELRLNGEPVESVKKGDNFSMPLPEMIRSSDRLYKVIDRE